MRKNRITVSLDVDDVLYECVPYAIRLANKKYKVDQKELDKAHMAQVQSLINEVHLRDETLLSSKEQLLLLTQERKDPWWKKLLK